MPSQSTTAFDPERTRDLAGRGHHVWYRRAVLGLMLAIVIAALAGRFGQRQHTRVASGPAAALSIAAPQTIRGGLMWPARITVRARQKLVSPTVVLGAGFVDGMQLNTIEPSPAAEATRSPDAGGEAALAFTYPTLEAGDTLTVYLQLQVDPTIIGREDVSVSLESANGRPVRSPASLTVLP